MKELLPLARRTQRVGSEFDLIELRAKLEFSTYLWSNYHIRSNQVDPPTCGRGLTNQHSFDSMNSQEGSGHLDMCICIVVLNIKCPRQCSFHLPPVPTASVEGETTRPALRPANEHTTNNLPMSSLSPLRKPPGGLFFQSRWGLSRPWPS
jgi:hypothetical protein